MTITIRTFDDPAEALADPQIQDRDVVILPSLHHGVIAVCTVRRSERKLWSLTRHDLHGIEEIQEPEPWTEGRYADSVKAALDLLNQAADTVIPYYNPRFRLADCFIPNRTRDRGCYEVFGTHGSPIDHVWYSAPGQRFEGIFVGWLLIEPVEAGNPDSRWIPVHRDGHALPMQHRDDAAKDELIRYDLAATAEEKQ